MVTNQLSPIIVKIKPQKYIACHGVQINTLFRFKFRGKRTERFLSELLIRHVKTTCKKQQNNVRGNLPINGIKAEIKL